MQKISALFICMMMYYSYAQNVGIGTKYPQNKLHVAGGLRIDSLASKKDSGLILHNRSGDLFSLGLTGNKSDVLRGDGTFSTAAAPTDAWLVGGNTGTDTSNFLGTKDAAPLLFRVGNYPFGGFVNEIRFRTSFGIGLYASTAGAYNIALGSYALWLNKNGNNNIAIGTNAIAQAENSQGNIAIGTSALTMGGGLGGENIAIGLGTQGEVLGTQNVSLGHRSLQALNRTDVAIASYNVAVGNESIESGSYAMENVAVGYRALKQTTVGGRNVAVGHEALMKATDGIFQVAVGYRALYNSNVNQALNTAVGYRSMFSTTNGMYNVANGHEALFTNTSGSRNTSVGYQSMFLNTSGFENVAFGALALYNNTTGNYLSSGGYMSLYKNTTGNHNTAFGYYSLNQNTTGILNTAFGSLALIGTTTGVNNTGAGYRAMARNVTGSNNTGVGMYADVTLPGLNNATAIGYNARVNASNKVRIGNASVTVIEGQVPFTTPSDGRFKFNVQENVGGLDFILKLRPVTYQFDVKRFDHVGTASTDRSYEQAAAIKRSGFIAQEVEQAANETNYDFSGVIKPANENGHYSLSYESFVVPLVKAVQEQQMIINQLREQLAKQEEKINELQKKKK